MYPVQHDSDYHMFVAPGDGSRTFGVKLISSGVEFGETFRPSGAGGTFSMARSHVLRKHHGTTTNKMVFRALAQDPKPGQFCIHAWGPRVLASHPKHIEWAGARAMLTAER